MPGDPCKPETLGPVPWSAKEDIFNNWGQQPKEETVRTCYEDKVKSKHIIQVRPYKLLCINMYNMAIQLGGNFLGVQ